MAELTLQRRVAALEDFGGQADRSDPSGIDEGTCLACHKPLTDADYSFTYETLREFDLAN